MRLGDVIEANRCGKVTSVRRHRSLCARRRDEIAIIIIIGGLTSPTHSLSLCDGFPYFRISCVGHNFTCVSRYVQLGLRVLFDVVCVGFNVGIGNFVCLRI